MGLPRLLHRKPDPRPLYDQLEKRRAGHAELLRTEAELRTRVALLQGKLAAVERETAPPGAWKPLGRGTSGASGTAGRAQLVPTRQAASGTSTTTPRSPQSPRTPRSLPLREPVAGDVAAMWGTWNEWRVGPPRAAPTGTMMEGGGAGGGGGAALLTQKRDVLEASLASVRDEVRANNSAMVIAEARIARLERRIAVLEGWRATPAARVARGVRARLSCLSLRPASFV